MMTLVWELELPASEKLVLLALADCANDEGHCWPGIATLKKKCSKSERTIQGCIRTLCEKGHLTRREVVGKGCNYVVHPTVGFADIAPADTAPRRNCATQPLPETPAEIAVTPAAAAPKPSKNRKEPSPIKCARELPDDWGPAEFAIGSESRKVVDGWPPGELVVQLEMFRAQHGKRGDKFVDWQKAWSTWVLNTRKFGIGRHERSNESLTASGLNKAFPQRGGSAWH
jgi:Helix-turn-helix domain